MSNVVKIVCNPFVLALGYSVYNNPHYTTKYGLKVGTALHLVEAIAAGVGGSALSKIVTLQNVSGQAARNFAAAMSVVGMIGGYTAANYGIKNFDNKLAAQQPQPVVQQQPTSSAAPAPLVPSKDGKKVYAALPKHTK